jgi:hypothetical protein
MAQLSKKSQRFYAWITRCFGKECGVKPKELLIELERAARLVVHDLDAMGEPSKISLHALARASKKLTSEYND